MSTGHVYLYTTLYHLIDAIYANFVFAYQPISVSHNAVSFIMLSIPLAALLCFALYDEVKVKFRFHRLFMRHIQTYKHIGKTMRVCV